jgi:hypothetical protein
MAWRLTIRKKIQCARRQWKHKMKVIPLHFVTKCQKIIVLHFRKATMVLGTTTSKKKNWKQHYARWQWNCEIKVVQTWGEGEWYQEAHVLIPIACTMCTLSFPKRHKHIKPL